ncbi:MAG: FHA domain-containing protein, partial [Pyrinomonadaceae bacterium]
MKIILAEEYTGQNSEKQFDQPVILIGREPNECQVVFDNSRFSMVSRRHAEIRRTEGKWILTDLGSSYGTFIDGQKISAPQTLSEGNRLQFGLQGPVMRVVRLESFSGLPSVNKEVSAIPVNNPVVQPPIKQNPVSQTEIPGLIFVNDGGRPAFNFTKTNIWLGRESNCDIVFDADAVIVSRRHAEIRNEKGNFLIEDNGSFNGTLVNEQRISTPTPIYHEDEIQLGMGGPVLRFNAPSRVAPKGASLAGQRAVPMDQIGNLPIIEHAGSKTMVANLGNMSQKISDQSAKPQLLMSLVFGGKKELIIGREDASHIKLDGLQISNRHARLLQTNSGVVVEDLGSTNGVFVNENKVSKQIVLPQDSVYSGTFLIKIDGTGNISVFDTRSKTRIDSINITKDVKNRSGGGMLR